MRCAALVVALLLAGPLVPAAPVALAQPATAKAKDLQSVDWANRNYGRHIRLRDGRYTLRRYLRRDMRKARRCMHTTQSARLIKVHYAELDGDGKVDALVELSQYANYCSGMGRSSRVFIAFDWSGAGPVERTRLSLPQVSKVHVTQGKLRIERRDAKDGKWVDCAEVWRLRGKAFTQRKRTCKPAK